MRVRAETIENDVLIQMDSATTTWLIDLLEDISTDRQGIPADIKISANLLAVIQPILNNRYKKGGH